MTRTSWEFTPITFSGSIDEGGMPENIGWTAIARFSPDETVINEKWTQATGILIKGADRYSADLAISRMGFIAKVVKDLDAHYRKKEVMRIST